MEIHIFCHFCHLTFNHECLDDREATIFDCKQAFEVVGSPSGSEAETHTTKKSLASRVHRKCQEGRKGLQCQRTQKNTKTSLQIMLQFVK